MAVAEGRNGLVTIVSGASSAPVSHTVAELGNWAVSGISRDMVEFTAFGDTVKKFKPGMLDPGGITFAGFYDGTDDTGQRKLVQLLSSGVSIGTAKNSTVHRRLRLWANSDSDFDSFGFWSCTGSTGSTGPIGKIYITSMDLGQDKNGLGTVSFSAKVSAGSLAWCTSTA